MAPGLRGDQKYVSGALRIHLRQHKADRVRQTQQVGLDNVAPPPHVARHSLVLGSDPGAGNQKVNATEIVDSKLRERRYLHGIADVAGDEIADPPVLSIDLISSSTPSLVMLANTTRPPTRPNASAVAAPIPEASP